MAFSLSNGIRSLQLIEMFYAVHEELVSFGDCRESEDTAVHGFITIS